MKINTVDRNRKLKLQELIRGVKRKYAAMKLGKSEEDETLDRLYTPITKRLKRIEAELSKQTDISSSKIILKKPEIPQFTSTPQDRKYKSTDVKFKMEQYPQKNLSFISDPNQTVISKTDNNDSVFIGGDDNDERTEEFIHSLNNSEVVEDYLDQYPEKVRNYIYSAFTEPQQYDSTFGPKYDKQLSKWMLGKSAMEFDRKTGDVLIENDRYPGTTGLYNLIFKKDPNGYTQDDMNNYGKILEKTNVHRKQFQPGNAMKGNRGYKYLKIIRPSTGHGLMTYNNKPVEFVYWDDINEIVNRFRLLYASKIAGNTSVENEIESIVEELREAEVIY